MESFKQKTENTLSVQINQIFDDFKSANRPDLIALFKKYLSNLNSNLKGNTMKNNVTLKLGNLFDEDLNLDVRLDRLSNVELASKLRNLEFT